ncbi:NAD(P)H-binding protein [Mycobacterium szulgai]|uniref:NAD(P)H-binding protein n=1 Tax=Mycobacterium szulgai TaxID=1787 RepID=UPI000A1E3549|nr:NAD(P)H-binding protein [Mycobacterium szulgai]MCV7074365.1 NAD(P)H-binding protein [Mycobacterium szulgai]
MTRTAVLAGASGAVGGEVLRALLKDPDWGRVHSLVRRPSGTEDPKLSEHVVNFDDLDAQGDLFADADVFCCLGTTASQAGSKEAFRRVDYGYVVKLAELAADAKARQFLLVSGIGTSPKSPFYYSRVKAEAEQAVSALPLPAVQIFRPSLLLASRPDNRPAEDAFKKLTPLANLLLIGPLARYRPVATAEVARHLIEVAKAQNPGVHVHYSHT